MYKIYFKKNVIIFTKSTVPQGAYVIEPTSIEPITLTKVLQKVENNKCVAILSENIDTLYAEFCSQLKVVDSAGGLVEDATGRLLMIQRNGVWDLPKGHLEAGESLEMCAGREVAEECGVVVDKVGSLIAKTMHIYPLEGEWILKVCYWYSMLYSGTAKPIPQTEEGVEKVVWLDRQQAINAASTSYGTIQEVLSSRFPCEE